jgi:hypothetical protein
MDKPGYVYILSSHSRVLYIGVTSFGSGECRAWSISLGSPSLRMTER